ncbi:MAG: site-specific DNA-methyltransferase [Gammaproteobacteria bacterium]|nr:site-specific DNA-methyltransferase [Gammaproteobacteria bacterium]
MTLTYDRLDKTDMETIATFNAAFDQDEVQLEPSGHQVTILFRQVDIRKLRNCQKALNGAVNPKLIQDVVSAIEGVKSYGIANGKRNYVDYNKERKVKDRAKKVSSRSPYFYAQNHTHSETNNDFPAEYTDKIIVGDSKDILKNIPDNSIDLIFTSPPYNFGLEYAENQDAHYWETYFDQLFSVFDECIRVTKYGGRIIVNVQPLFSDYIPSHHLISNFFIQKKLIWKGEVLWEKNNYNCKYTAWGSWKSPSNPYLKYTWEFLEIFCKGEMKKPGSRDDIDINAEEFKKWVVAKWSIAPERKMGEYGHPAMFPEELAERVLKLFSYRGDIVLDPFNGSGTTTTVAARSGRRYLGIDISEEYCKTAERRLESVQCSMI